MMPVSSNKRKGRISSGSKLGRSKFYGEKNMSCDGVYGNSKLMYAAGSLVGCVVQVQVQNGNIFEGVLRCFSQQFDVVLETAHKVDATCPPMKSISPAVSNLIASYPFEGGIYDKLVFKLSDVIMLQACNVDLDYAVKDNFTDTAISKFNGQIKERELEPWEGAGSDSESTPVLIDDDDGGINGWDANDMFRLNAEKYGVKSSYDNSLQEYTVALTKKDTEEYKLQEAKALQIAQEIEKNQCAQSRLDLENGDEEDKFSAVVRPDDSIPTKYDSVPTKYVLPQKRRNIPGIRRQQSTSSPIHGTSPKPPYTALHTSSSNIPNPGGGPPFSAPPSLPILETPPQHIAGPFSNTTTISQPPASGSNVTTASSVLPKSRVVPKSPDTDDTITTEIPKLCPESTNVGSVPSPPGPTKMQVLCPSQPTLPPRIERRRENEKKMAKQKGRTDEIEEFKKFSSNFKLSEEKDPNEPEEVCQSSEAKVEQLASKIERTKLDKDEDKTSSLVKFSTLNPNAKEFVFNPNAKSFTPRSMSGLGSQATLPLQPPPPPPVLPQRMQPHDPGSSMMTAAIPHSQMIPSMHHQPIFTAMAPQYVMQAAPVSMALTPFAAPVSQTTRFRKTTGQPILAAPASAIPATPSQLTVQYAASPQGVIHASAPNQAAVGYSQMNFIVGPRVVSPQPVGVIPTSHAVSYCDTSHLPTHLIMSAHPGATHPAASTPHATHLQQTSTGQPSSLPPHPPQSQTPVIHPSPSPVQQIPPPPQTPNQQSHSQPPTPTTTLMAAYAGPQHPLHQAMNHHHHPMHPHSHHPGFPGAQPGIVLMQQQAPPHQPSAHHHPAMAGHHHHHTLHHMHSLAHHHQNHTGGPPHMGASPHILGPQMTIIPTSAAITPAPTPPFVQHP